MNTRIAALLAALCLTTSSIFAAAPNVLVIGSTQPYSTQQGVKTSDEASITALVKDRLSRDMKIRGSINIVFEDIYRTKQIDTAVGGGGNIRQITHKCHSLAQWLFWPEGRDERLASLQNKGQTKWDAIVLMGDASLIINMPGVMAEGTSLIIDEIRKGTAKPILLVPAISGPEAKAVAEAVCRVGMSADVPVLPSPSAMTIKTIASSGFDAPTPFSMKYVDKRDITYNHTGTSSERGIEGALKAAAKRCGVTAVKTSPEKHKGNIDFNYGRGNSGFEKHKQYKVEPHNFDRSYGFPMQDHSKSASVSMLYGIDRRADDGTDLGIAWDMIKQNEVEKDIRCIPIRLMSAKLRDLNPALTPCGDSWHMSKYLNTASGTFIYTLLSGRCPVGDEPGPDNTDARNHWLGQKVGYETAWRMSHVTARAPGFVVRPAAANQLTVRFLNPPNAEVAVAVAADQAGAAEVSPKTLTFTPENYSELQTVSIRAGGDAGFAVKLVTRSTDSDFNRLHDSWPFATSK